MRRTSDGFGGVVAELVKVRRLTDQEGQQLQRIVRRGSTNTVRYRRAMMLLASAGGNRVPVIAQLVQADEDTVRDVIHRFNQIGPACLDPRWAGGRPRLLSPDDEDFVVQTATIRPTKLGQPFTRWSIRKLAAYLRKVHGRVIRIGREALRCLLARRGVTFQRTKTWKESTDPDYHAKLDRIEHALAVLNGRAADVANRLDAEAADRHLDAENRKKIAETVGYLRNKDGYLGYDTALAAGWPIATGIVEGACRHLIGDRLDITGARWSLAGAEAVLRLRALLANGDFDRYWTFHLDQEHQRNHRARYRLAA
jgi:transposase